jgi:hypothetical protein
MQASPAASQTLACVSGGACTSGCAEHAARERSRLQADEGTAAAAAMSCTNLPLALYGEAHAASPSLAVFSNTMTRED